MKKLIFLFALFMGGMLTAMAGGHGSQFGEKVKLTSKILNEDRMVMVYTPDSYTLSNQDYPVMYLLDGESHFFHASGIVQFLSSQGLMPEMIVVAIKNVDRTRDFSPTTVDKWPNTGGAEKFMSFISDELIPKINEKYRTHEYKVLVGHSFGGEFATYALLNRPDVFNGYIAISPYMMYDNNFMIGETKAKLQASYDENVTFFMTVGDEPDYYATLDEFQSIVESKSPENFQLKYKKFSHDDHGSVTHISIYKGLKYIYDGWKLNKEQFKEGLAAIDDHYEMLSEKFGYAVNTPEMTINQLGYWYLGNEDMKNALKVFKANIKRYPESANVYDSYAEALENNNQFAEAEKYYGKAVKLAEMSHHVNLEIYQKNLARMQEKMASM